jgi:hypothetical protein
MSETVIAKEITLKKTKSFAPPFHHHIARKKLINEKWQKGDQIIIYEIEGTVPDGKVLVTKDTIIHFEQE